MMSFFIEIIHFARTDLHEQVLLGLLVAADKRLIIIWYGLHCSQIEISRIEN